jgi:DNA-binding transcriptional LysR family regulator
VLGYTLRQLEIFLAVAREGRLALAAERLHLSSSAVSMALKELEAQLGLRLFEKVGRHLELSAHGRRLAREAPGLLGLAEALPGRLQGEAGELSGELSIAASTTIGRYLLPPLIAAFSHAHAQVRIRLTVANARDAAAALASGRADVAFVEGVSAAGGFDAGAWQTDRLAVVMAAPPSGYRVAAVTPERLQRLDWILREPGSGTREIFEHALSAAGLKPPLPRLVFDDTEAVKRAVAAGWGAGCLSLLAVGDLIEAGRLIELPTPFLTLERTLWWLRRPASELGPIAAAFCAHAGIRLEA